MISQPPRETGLGIASFVLSLVMLVLWFVLVAFAAAAVAGGATEEDPVLIAVGLFIFVGIGANIAGIIFGIIAVTRTNVKKTLGAIGLSLNAVELLGILFLMILGSAS